MAINLLNENNEIRCRKCDSNIFNQKETFTLKNNIENKEDKMIYKKDVSIISIICDNCDEIFYSYKHSNS